MHLDALRRRPNALVPDYSRFRVGERLLLTGHSHQAWPDCGFAGQQQAWLDAAERVDGKWEEAFARAERVRRGYTRLLGDDPARGHIVLANSTHDLLVRLLSALPLRERPRLVTTDGEFHSIRRQLDRLEEEGVEVVRVPTTDHDTIAGRLVAAVDDRTCLVLASSVLFGSARLVSGLDDVLAACLARGADLLVDAYHHLNAVPFSIPALGLDEAFVVGGGYKYCQLGEGNAFLRVPADRALRPAVTGWFAEFSTLDTAERIRPVPYDAGPDRFAGATYDPTSHYRAAVVFDFFEHRGLTPEFLREVSRHQVGLLATAFDALDLDPAVITRDRSLPLERIAGFLVLKSPRADAVCRQLRDRGVLTDSRGDSLRLGPAPYLDDEQLLEAIEVLGEIIRADPASDPCRTSDS